MTKIEAIESVLRENGGSANLNVIYNKIQKFYPKAKESKEWEAGIRGVLYRELRKGSRFKKIGLSIYALKDYEENPLPKSSDKVKMHSFMQGICLELGNARSYLTYTADSSKFYRDNVYLKDIANLKNLPNFTYKEIINETRRIDVLWFNNAKCAFPQCAFEIVDSVSTLNNAFNRCLQLKAFATKFYIVAPQIHRKKFEQNLELEIYRDKKDFFEFVAYDEMLTTYEHFVTSGLKDKRWLFGV
ncbi:hypothetical protein [Campylobacter upsaliensis]|uniref:HTH HARE-type domain-containing protein n=1 Tax=Campylobacter upsaliensis TaxID=28080 RepID=A0A381EGD0_CAMUP|nr:hypothetical protein [Campylobacter upsaliensis]MCR2101108.1 hypothetical protein [Campylobacter upsaliensis]SUX26000.1 Uncharacterised protein [Campylobacter upsaliensis]